MLNSITKLMIQNFQSHTMTELVPAPNGQLTVITGPSDTGKTVVLRALRWLLFNEPQGSDFIRVGASMARVTLELESGHTVIRERTKATNRYKIIVPGGAEPQVFEGFGSSVPVEVQEITGARHVQIGDLELNLNLAEQLDGPFLGRSISAGARAKVLGKLAGTEEIDHAAKQLATDLYRRGQDEKHLTGEVERLDEQLGELDWLPGMGRKIEQLEQLAERVRQNQARRDQADQLRTRLAEVDEKIVSAQAVLLKWRNLERVNELVNQAQENENHKDDLISYTNDYWTYQKSIWACEKVVAQYAGLHQAEEQLQAAGDAAGRARQLRNLRTSYRAGTEMIQKSRDVLSELQGIDQAGELVAGMQEKITRRDVLERLALSYGNAGMYIAQAQVRLEALRQVPEAEGRLQAADEKRGCRERLLALRDKHAGVSEQAEKTRGQVVMWENRVAELEGAYRDELNSIGMCPTCGALKNEMRIKEVV